MKEITQDGWISVKDRPLFKKTDNNFWLITEDGEKDFLAAVPYNDKSRPNEKDLWWIRHCTIEDTGLCVVGDDINESAGWSLEDVTHWQHLPKPPIK